MRVPNFDRVARAYRWLEYSSFGPLLTRCRLQYLDKLSNCRHALVLGDGDGRFSSHLLALNPTITIEAIDVSASMLSLLLARARALSAENRVTTHQTDIRTFHPRGEFDLVVSHFFLDCLTDRELCELIERVKATLTPKAQWVVSEFAIPQEILQRGLAKALIGFLYRAFHLLTGLKVHHLPNYIQAFQEQGFLLVAEKKRLGGILVSQIWQPLENTL